MLFSPILDPSVYLDPGSGSIIIQLIIATILGLGVVIRSQWSKIKKFFGKKTIDNDDTNSEE